MNPAYWKRQLRETVYFAAGLDQFAKESPGIFIKIGPGGDFGPTLKQHQNQSSRHLVISTIRYPQQVVSDTYHLLHKIGLLWLHGCEIHWERLYEEGMPKRISLPAYPFERRKYDIKQLLPTAAKQPLKQRCEPAKLSGKKADIADWFYIPIWKPTVPYLNNIEPTSFNFASSRIKWLIFVDEWGLGEQLAEKLRPGHDIVIVKEGAGFTKIHDWEYIINPGEENGYFVLMDHLLSIDYKADNIVHCWNVGHNNGTDADQLKRSMGRAFYSLLFLARALGRKLSGHKVKILVISNNMQALPGDTLIYPEKALILGPVGSISVEYPDIMCYSIDIGIPFVIPPSIPPALFECRINFDPFNEISSWTFVPVDCEFLKPSPISTPSSAGSG